MKNLWNQCDKLKAELDGLRPIETKYLGQIKKFWQVGLAYSSNALEGNTLTETETKVILEDGITIGGKSVREHMEALGHKDALSFLFEIYENGYSEQVICELHRLFYFRIDSISAGKYRTANVIITGTDYLPPNFETVGELMAGFGSKISKKVHPLEHAAKAHEELVNIHPFIDGNGRTARLLLNLILLQSGFPVVVIPPIYRARYIDAARAGNRGNSRPFLEFLAQVTEQGLTDYLRMLEKLQ